LFDCIHIYFIRLLFAREQNTFQDVQQQRQTVQNEIREEMQLVESQKRDTKRDFFVKEQAEEDDQGIRSTAGLIARHNGKEKADFQVTNEVELLQQKMEEKIKLMQTIAPVLVQMKGKFYFSLSKRKQRNQLNKLHKKLAQDVALLQKAIDLLSR